MAITLVMEFQGMGREKYDAVMKELGLDRPNAQWPKGIISHIAGPIPSGWCVVDTWESQQAWEAFLGNQLSGAMQKVGGVPKPEPKTFTVHNAHGLAVPITR